MTRIMMRLAAVLVGLVVAVGFAEAALRVAGVAYPNFVIVDAERGYAGRPGAEGWFRSEGAAYVRINSDGLRDREHTLAKPDDAYRIAVVGDSFAAAIHVPMENAFWAVMERELNRCPTLPPARRTVEVINFGVDGYSTAMELLTVRHQVWKYSPDMVLLAFWPGNDVWENHPLLAQRDETPYFILRHGKLVPDNSFRQSAAYARRTSRLGQFRYWLLDWSRAYQVVDKTLLGYQRRKEVYAMRARTRAVLGDVPSLGIGKMVYQEPTHPLWREAWRITDALLVQLHQEVQGHGAQFVVATLSTPEQVHPDAERRAAIKKTLGVRDLFYPERRVTAIGRRDGFPVLALGPRLLAYVEQTGAYLHGFDNTKLGTGHWNVTGHDLGGRMLATELCTSALLR